MGNQREVREGAVAEDARRMRASSPRPPRALPASPRRSLPLLVQSHEMGMCKCLLCSLAPIFLVLRLPSSSVPFVSPRRCRVGGLSPSGPFLSERARERRRFSIVKERIYGPRQGFLVWPLTPTLRTPFINASAPTLFPSAQVNHYVCAEPRKRLLWILFHEEGRALGIYQMLSPMSPRGDGKECWKLSC